MYVKYIDESTIEVAPKVLKDKRHTYSNPMPKILARFGYKPLVEVECPNENGYTYTLEYVEDDEQVTKTWCAHEVIVEELIVKDSIADVEEEPVEE